MRKVLPVTSYNVLRAGKGLNNSNSLRMCATTYLTTLSAAILTVSVAGRSLFELLLRNARAPAYNLTHKSRQHSIKHQPTAAGRTSVRYRFGSPFSSKRLWFVDTVLWLCPSLPTETLNWLSSLPILMQKSFWWWQCSDRYIISLSPHLHTPSPPSPRP